MDRIQWTGHNPYAVRDFVGMHRNIYGGNHHIFTVQSGIERAELFVAATDSWVPLRIGDWVVKSGAGFDVCRSVKITQDSTRRGLRKLKSRRRFLSNY